MKTAAEYHAVADGIRDIYIQELTAPGKPPRLPDEGGWIEWFHHWREEGRDFDWIRAEIRKSDEWHAVHDQPQPRTLPRLVPSGSVFRLETGERFTAIECSDFNLFGRYLIEGEAVVRDVFKERSEIGFNLLRVWSEYRGNAQFTADIGRLVPSEHDFYGQQLTEFLGLASAYGLYVELTAFTGTGIPGHWEVLTTALQGVTNVIVELANEVNAHPSIDPTQYQPIPGIVCSHGSNGSGSPPVRPPWPNGYEAFHTNDARQQMQWWRKGSHNGMEFSEGDAEGVIIPSHLPVIANENTRPDQDPNVDHFYDAAAACALLIGGSCLHTQTGKKSALFGQGPDRVFADAHVAGAKSVPLAFQDGAYSHVISDEGPADLRAYRKTLPDGRYWLVRIRK